MTSDIKQRIKQINRGEVPQGYKKTEVGIVPNEWESEDTFGDLFDFYGGLGIPRDQLSENGVPYLHYGDMHKEYFTKASYEKYNQLPKYDTKLKGDETYLIQDGDMVFLDASEDLAGTSRCVVIDNPENLPFISGLHTFVAKPKKQALYKEYKQYLTAPQMVQRQFEKLASGFKVYGLNRNTVKQISIAYPRELNEQQNIAEILSKWDKAIALQEKLIAKLEEQKKALMQKLLAPKEGWRSMSLGEIGEISSAGVDKKIIAGERTVRLLNYMDVYKSMYLYDSTFTHTVTAPEDKVNNCDVKKYDIFFTPTSETQDDIAHSAVAMEDAKNVVYSYHVVRLRPQKKFNSLGLVAILQSWQFQKQAQKYAKGSGTRYVISLDDFRQIQISTPNSIELLEKIGFACFSKTHEIELHVTKLQKLKQQQKALQQLLLTGIVRV